MNIKNICFGAVALSMISGYALAAGGENTTALDDQAKMAPFYTDSGMKTMRGTDEFKAAWMAMTKDDQMSMAKACDEETKNANATNTHPEFCSNVKALGGSM